MTLELVRRISFCAGHRLLHHEGKCANFHGHNYVAEVHVRSESGTLDAVGRVIDFAEIKARLKGWIDEHWDHAFLLWDRDENGLAAIRATQPHKLFVMPANPTAEVMADYLLREVAPKVLAGLGVVCDRVALWETPESCAIATRD